MRKHKCKSLAPDLKVQLLTLNYKMSKKEKCTQRKKENKEIMRLFGRFTGDAKQLEERKYYTKEVIKQHYM